MFGLGNHQCEWNDVSRIRDKRVKAVIIESLTNESTRFKRARRNHNEYAVSRKLDKFN